MSGFRLLGLRTGSECRINVPEIGELDFLKSLSPNTFYPFYNDFEIRGRSLRQSTRIEVKYDKRQQLDLYSTKNLDINISAIVGANGTGKSTLIDLLLLGFYNVSASLKQFEFVSEENIGVMRDLDELEAKREYYKPLQGVDLEILFEIDGVPRMIKINDENCYDIQFERLGQVRRLFSANDPKLIEEFKELESYFYSIVVNYSHYALNSKQMGDWIIQLYHKNDGYQAPIVINPMRTDGNIDINRENELVRARLLSNVLEPIQDSENSLRNLSNGREVESISLKLNKWKVANKIAKRENRFDLFIEKEKDIKEYIKEELKNDKKRFQINLNDKQYLSFAEELFDFKIAELDSKSEIIIYTVNYLAIKIEEVANRYSFDDVDPGEFINDLRIVKAFKKDRSHVMFKIRQTIYFLKYYNLWKELIALDDPIPLQKIVEVITKIKGKEVKNEDTLNTVELIPPPSFKVEFNLNDGISFDSLSSGEKQMIYSLSSVAYHLVNISSVRESGSLNKYHYVNLVFDEIELYYHPDWQRRYISELISYLKKINPSLIKDIHGVNFLFITHSPFILSDIPSNNVLKLDRAEGELTSKPVKDNTESFAANIHQLLANDFFMKEGVMGEFARQKLENVVDYLRLQKLRHDREELRKDLVRIREEELNSLEKKELNVIKLRLEITDKEIELLEEMNLNNLNKKWCSEIIQLIDEPVIRLDLKNLYDEVRKYNPDF